MFLKEAIWIRDVLARLDLHTGQTVIDFGSSTEEYRCLIQPYIDYYIFRPLKEKGLKIIYTDLKKDKGIDIVCDLTKSDSDAILQRIGPADVILCTSLLEHVTECDVIVDRLKRCVKLGGVIIISAPCVYRIHPDPIDTGYRPTNVELENLFSKEEYAKIRSEIIEVDEEPILTTNYLWSLFMRLINRIIKKLNYENIFKWQPRVIKNKVALVVMRKK